MVAKARLRLAENKTVIQFSPKLLIKQRVEYQMTTPNKPRKSERKSADLNRRAEDLQREIERLETILGPSVALHPQMSTNNADNRFNVGT